MVCIDDELLGGIDLIVLQNILCAQGQHVGMVLRSAAERAVISKTMEEALLSSIANIIRGGI